MQLSRLFVYTSNWIEPDQLNPQTAFYWVRCGGECIYHSSCCTEKKTACSSSYSVLRPPRQVDAANINTMGAATGAVSPLMPSSLTLQQAQHKTTLSLWLKVLSALISYTALCYGWACWIPTVFIVVKHFLFSFPLRGCGQKRRKSPCTERFTFSSSQFFAPIIQGRKPASTSLCAINGCA